MGRHVLPLVFGLFFCACASFIGAGEGSDNSPTVDPGTNGSSEPQQEFQFGVWLQGHSMPIRGKTTAQLYSEAGVKVAIGLYNFPYEDGVTYPGQDRVAVHTIGHFARELTAIKDAGMIAYAGDTVHAVDYLENHPEFDARNGGPVKGFMVADEPDMFGVSPQQLASRVQQLSARAPWMERYVNFGKPFKRDFVDGVMSPFFYNLQGFPNAEALATAYLSVGLDIATADLYAYTDPYERSACGQRVCPGLPNDGTGFHPYGKFMDALEYYVDQIPNRDDRPKRWGGFLELSSPFSDNQSGLFPQIPTEYIMPTVWLMITRGAQFIAYFSHNFGDHPVRPEITAIQGCRENYAVCDEEVYDAMKATNLSVLEFSKVLMTPSITGTSVTTDKAVGVSHITKQYNGKTYIFTVGDGDVYFPLGESLNAEFTNQAAAGKRIEAFDPQSQIRTQITVDSSGNWRQRYEARQIWLYSFEN